MKSQLQGKIIGAMKMESTTFQQSPYLCQRLGLLVVSRVHMKQGMSINSYLVTSQQRRQGTRYISSLVAHYTHKSHDRL